jgi:hypothetical protein
MGPASVRITAPGMTPQDRSLKPFMAAGHAYTPVGGPSDGCGAATNLAILPKAGSQLPYVVAFVVLAEKGCLPVPIVFVPIHASNGYRYAGAPYFELWSSQPKALSRIRVATVDRLSLPSGSAELHPDGWDILVVTNALPAGPRVAAFAPPDKPKRVEPGSTILMGSYYTVWFAK